MAATHTTALRNGFANLVTSSVDAGTANISGNIQIAADPDFTDVLSTMPLQNPSFATAVSGLAVAASIAPDPYTSGTGAAAFFRVISRDNVEVFRGTVTPVGGGGDLQLSSVNIAEGDMVAISSFVYQACP